MSVDQARALLITGAVGVGKTTVTDAIGELLAERGIPGAAIDLDWLCRSWPAPVGDRFNNQVGLANLRAVSGVYRRAGAQVLVAAGVLEERAARAEYEAAFGCPMTVVRLIAPREVVRARLRRRHDEDPAALTWHLERFDELSGILDAARVQDMSVQIGEDPRQTARAVLEHVVM